MERESFEDDEIASLLNEGFIAIKVDREERPDIDHIYMSVCQALTGSGGWPLSIFMTPDKEPFFAGTYFPKHTMGGMRGFSELLMLINEKYESDRSEISTSARKIISAVKGMEGNAAGAQKLDEKLIKRAVGQFSQAFDAEYGGFGRAPKFPTPHNLSFLLRIWASEGDFTALTMVEKTLDAMRRGGIYDHIGGGFCRYSTDKYYLAPHFEKMLYDNALLMITYMEAYQATKQKSFSITVREVVDYVLRTMVSEEGGFYSAEDADSEGEEGKFYLWTVREVLDALGEDDGQRFCAIYNISHHGNFEGKNIPNLIKGDLTAEDIDFARTRRAVLYDEREKRIHPHKDDKILTAWNGLMIAALSKAGAALKDDRFIAAAEKAADFVLKKLVREDGRLLARYRDGEARYPAYAEDYAFFVWGLIELYEATFDVKWLKKAVELTDALISLFWDEKDNGLYVYGSDAEQLIFRPKNVYDGAMPSANSVFAQNCLTLSGLTGRTDYDEKASAVFSAFSSSLSGQPMGHAHLLSAYLYSRTPAVDVSIACKDIADAAPMLDVLRAQFRPFARVTVKTDKNGLDQIAPFTEFYESVSDRPTAYVCRNHTCKPPVVDIKQFSELL